MATDTFTGSAAALATHDSNWFLADTVAGESLADLRIDGSGFAFQNNGFGQTRAAYTGTTSAEKSEVVIPIGAFVTVASGELIGVALCASAGNKGFEATVGFANITGQVINSVRLASNGAFITTQTLSPTIDTAAVALTISLTRTSTTNVNLIVNGTTYPINTTGVDITTGQGSLLLHRNSGTPTTLKFDSWTNGVAGGTTITPTAGSLALTGTAPSVSASGSSTLAPTAGALAFTGSSPTLTLTVAAPGVGALTFTGVAPTLSLGTIRGPTAGSLTLTGTAPTIAAVFTTSRVPTAGTISFTSSAPSVANSGGPQSIVTVSGSLSFTGFAPSLQNSGIVGGGPALFALDMRRRLLLS